MSTEAIIVIVAVVVIVLAALASWMWNNSKREKHLKERFGPEYDEAVSRDGRDARRNLEEREKRVQKLQIKDLSPEQQQRFSDEWRMVQGRFVDDPRSAIGEADRLCQQVMDARGYPLTGFDQQAEDISVDHPEVVSNYRSAHEIAQQGDDASTEDLRQAMIHYRVVFGDLLGAVPVR
jgi:hypothetical protein